MMSRFYIGPMSKNIVDSIINFCELEKYNIGLIASRRQIDYDSGYVNNWNTSSFYNYVKGKTNKVLVCRDHGGIGQGEFYDNGSISFYNDVNLDIVHVDPWKRYPEVDDAINETVESIKFIHHINNNCKFEVGTEESIQYYSAETLDYFLKRLQDMLGDIYNNVVYGVIQSGTKLIGRENHGIFNEERCKQMVNVCHTNGLLSKEHNGDYLTNQEIRKRFDLGLDSINIAPEYGVFETQVILDNLSVYDKQELYNICFKSEKWVKWFPTDFIPEDNKELLVEVCGHYLFDNEDFKKIKYKIVDIDNKIQVKLYEKLKNLREI